MSDNLLGNQPEETPEIAWADKWLQRLLTYAGLPAGIISLIYSQTYLAIICFLWLAAAVGYSIIKHLRKSRSLELGISKLGSILPIKENNPALPPPATETEPKPQQTQDNEEKEKSLYEFYQSDFKLISIGHKTTFTTTDKKTGKKLSSIVIENKLLIDFSGKSEFLAFYIPSSIETFFLCKECARHHATLIADFKNSVYSEGGIRGERPTSSKELVFTGRIYIYHESGLMSDQKRELETFFEARGLSLILRDPSYAFDQNFIRNTYPKVISQKKEKP